MSFDVENFIAFLAVKKFCISVKFWPSYSKLNLARFLGHSVQSIVSEVINKVDSITRAVHRNHRQLKNVGKCNKHATEN